MTAPGLTSRAELLECIAVLVDVLRRADPAYCRSHGVEHVTDTEWDIALQAAEDVLDANEVTT